MKQCFLNGAPPGSKGSAAPSGYMNSDLFVNEYLPFFIKQTRCTRESPVMLILDNHISHVSLAAVELCKSSGIVLLTLPPHCSHRLQPLDRTIYGPLKTYYNKAMDDWMRMHPARAVTIYEVGNLGGIAFTKAMSTSNILSGFSSTGIYPLDSSIFGEHEFLPSAVTDRPLAADEACEVADTTSRPQRENSVSMTPSSSEATLTTPAADVIGSTPRQSGESPSTSRQVHVTPDQLIPLPKAGPRKPGCRQRRKTKSAILTDTPEKNRIEMEMLTRAKRKGRGSTVSVSKKKRASSKKNETIESSSDEELAQELLYSDEGSADEEQDDIPMAPTKETINVNDHVLVKYETDKQSIYYTGRVMKCDDGIFTINFMRKVGDSCFFVYPDKEDIHDVDLAAIVLILGDPVTSGGTLRVRSRSTFRVDLSSYNNLR